MTNPNYKKGAAFELVMLHKFEALGYFSTRSSGSHGKGDLILFPILGKAQPIEAVHNGKPFVCDPLIPKICQCKRSESNYKKEKEEFAALKFDCPVNRLWISKKDYQKEIIEVV